MKAKHIPHYAVPAMIGAFITLAALFFLQSLIIPIAVFVLGFYVAGLVFPDVLDELTGFGHTLWLPVGFAAVGVAGLFMQFGADSFQIITTLSWCAKAPCMPVGMVFVAFFLGTAAILIGDSLSGKKVDLFGDRQKAK